MTILDDYRLLGVPSDSVRPVCGAPARRRADIRPVGRPAVTPLRQRGYAIAVSSAVHSSAVHPSASRRTVSTPVTVGLAGLAALITVWLGLLWQAGAQRDAVPAAPERLAVVHVLAGETLQQLAGRVAPDAPADQVAARIRDLNELTTAAIEAGQTLIAPVA